jgi:pimeloyl-ACP methyl ester carboxylesterase
MRWLTICVLAVGPALGWSDDSDGRLVNVGDHNLFVRCTGLPSSDTIVVLVNGLGAGLDSWKAVQSGIEKFARVCSYDRAGEGHSDKVSHLQTADAVVVDLRRVLEMERPADRYLLVGASLGGIYVRDFAQRYPDRIAGIVLVDSSHEEQNSRYSAISPALADRYSTQDGRFDRNEFLKATGQLELGKHLEWRLDVPLVVLEHKRLVGPPQNEMDRLAVVWHELQVDLAGRSKSSQLIETKSGHMIPVEQPEIIVDSVRNVLSQARQLVRP